MISLKNESVINEYEINLFIKLVSDLFIASFLDFNSKNLKFKNYYNCLTFSKFEDVEIIFNVDNFYKQFKIKQNYRYLKDDFTIKIMQEEGYEGFFNASDREIYVNENSFITSNFKHEFRHLIDDDLGLRKDNKDQYYNKEKEIRARFSEIDFDKLKKVGTKNELIDFIKTNHDDKLTKINLKKFVKKIYLLWLFLRDKNFEIIELIDD